MKQVQSTEPQLLKEGHVDLQCSTPLCKREEAAEVSPSESRGKLASEEGTSDCPMNQVLQSLIRLNEVCSNIPQSLSNLARLTMGRCRA